MAFSSLLPEISYFPVCITGPFPRIPHRYAVNMCSHIGPTHMIPCYQFIWNNLLCQRQHWSDQIPLKWIYQKKNKLTVKHARACANLLRLLLRHIYLIRLNQHRVVMIKHFSPISVWERDTDRGLPLHGWKAKSSSISQHFSLKTASVSSAFSSFPLRASFSLSFSLLSSFCLSICFSVYQWRHFLSPSWGKYGGLVGGGFQKGKWLPSRGRSREKKAGRLIAPASNSTAGYHPEPGGAAGVQETPARCYTASWHSKLSREPSIHAWLYGLNSRLHSQMLPSEWVLLLRLHASHCKTWASIQTDEKSQHVFVLHDSRFLIIKREFFLYGNVMAIE